MSATCNFPKLSNQQCTRPACSPTFHLLSIMAFSRFADVRDQKGASRYSGGKSSSKGTYRQREAGITVNGSKGAYRPHEADITAGRTYKQTVSDPQERTAEMDEAYNERLIASQHNAQAFTVACVLVQHGPDDVVHRVQSKESYVSLSRYLSWLLRNSGLFQKDGSLHLSELLCLPQLQKHLKGEAR